MKYSGITAKIAMLNLRRIKMRAKKIKKFVFKRLCKYCDKMFEPDGKYHHICNKCQAKAVKLRILNRRKKK